MRTVSHEGEHEWQWTPDADTQRKKGIDEEGAPSLTSMHGGHRLAFVGLVSLFSELSCPPGFRHTPTPSAAVGSHRPLLCTLLLLRSAKVRHEKEGAAKDQACKLLWHAAPRFERARRHASAASSLLASRK
jgi:hypothetical protein